ncbi:hypothetical protein [Vibrio sp. 1180_3]|uniref:hypothetical protein n=1 Tax=Vibrio sp. 1180_3 TaxID=2528832 RepID=UPI0024054B89|nr:hypothetical protein [Vibrio sp. 1180_3]MDF9399173.1 hypothetical protein [Vibrio sp. 1180_3]
MWNKTVEVFIDKPTNTWAFINYLKSLNKNQAEKLVDDIFGELYWIERGASWVKPNQDKRYISRAQKLMKIINRLISNGFFQPELTRLGNTIERSFVDQFETFFAELKDKTYDWLYGDCISCCITVEDDLQIMSYCEGDVTVVTCPDISMFHQERDCYLSWARENC